MRPDTGYTGGTALLPELAISIFLTGIFFQQWSRLIQRDYYLSCLLGGGMEMYMDKDKQELLNRKKSNEKFNSITQKVKPENQNQTHNVRSEAVEPKNRQV